MNPQPADIIKSKVIAKTVIQMDGQVHIIAVFNTSTYYHFFFHFTAPTARTPRKKWTYTKQYHMLFGDAFSSRGKTINYTMLSYSNQWLARLKGSSLKIKKYIPAKTLSEFFHHVASPLAQGPQAGMTYQHSSRITSGRKDQIKPVDRANALASYETILGNKLGNK